MQLMANHNNNQVASDEIELNYYYVPFNRLLCMSITLFCIICESLFECTHMYGLHKCYSVQRHEWRLTSYKYCVIVIDADS